MVASVTVDSKLATLRGQLPALTQTGYFNAGTNGPLPRVAHETLVTAATRELEAGRIVPGVYQGNWERNRKVATLLASMFNADEDEFALTHSTTEGMGAALMGLTWRPGDEVVTTNREHPGLLSPLSLLAHRFGVTVRQADIGNGGGDVAAAIGSLVSARTRVIALSHVIWSTGAVIPLEEISALARQHGALVVVDGAQSAGQVPIDLHGSGVDAYALPGQKWLCGPEGTGALYVRRDRLADIAPTFLRYAQYEVSGYLIPAPGARRFEIGEFYSPSILAQNAALTWLRDEVGLDWAYARTVEMGQRVQRGVEQIEGVSVITPAHRAAGLICFTGEGITPQEITSQLYERGMTIRYVDVAPNPPIARVSAAWWNTEEEIDELLAAIAEIVSAR